MAVAMTVLSMAIQKFVSWRLMTINVNFTPVAYAVSVSLPAFETLPWSSMTELLISSLVIESLPWAGSVLYSAFVSNWSRWWQTIIIARSFRRITLSTEVIWGRFFGDFIDRHDEFWKLEHWSHRKNALQGMSGVIFCDLWGLNSFVQRTLPSSTLCGKRNWDNYTLLKQYMDTPAATLWWLRTRRADLAKYLSKFNDVVGTHGRLQRNIGCRINNADVTLHMTVIYPLSRCLMLYRGD